MLDTSTMPERVARWLTAHVRPARVERYEIMTGGFSRVMARVDVRWEDGSTETVILRGDPPAELATLTSDRDAEWALLSGLRRLGKVPVPDVRWYVDDPEHFGSKALFVEHIPSRTLQAHLLEGLDQHAALLRWADMLASVATISPDDLPDAMPRPTDWHAYVDARIEAWRALADGHVEAAPIIRYLAAWMDANRPDPVPFTLVHGDPQAANVIVDDAGEWHLIDWEFSHVGDPREDLGYYNAYSSAVPPNLATLDLDRFLGRYRERTGLGEDAVNPVTFGWFTILSTLTAVEGLYGGIAGFTRGERKGTSVAFNAILVTTGHEAFVEATRQIDAGRDVTGAAR